MRPMTIGPCRRTQRQEAIRRRDGGETLREIASSSNVHWTTIGKLEA